MLVCRGQPHRLASLARASSLSRAFSTATTSEPISTSTSSAKPTSLPSQDSIFTAPESPWDHVFADIDKMPLLPAASRNSRRQNYRSPSLKPSVGTNDSDKGAGGILGRSSTMRARKESMTAREISVFDEMFNLIFNAVSEQREGLSSSSSPDPSALDQAPSIGRTPLTSGQNAPLNDLFHTLRRHSSRVRWTSASDEELDRKKEQMELCNTDQELLEWALREVFGESVRWDEEAKKALEAPPPLQPSTYPHLLAHLMRLFRTTYSNPSLSLSVFNHAARLSIPSYVFGCTSPAYNELIQAKWEGWGDLEGVCNALEEMRGNGVIGDGRTRRLVETVRREVGEARPVESLGEEEVMRLLTRVEELALREPPRKPKLSLSRKRGWKGGELWKSAVLKPDDRDGWEFDSWRREKTDKDERRGERKGKIARRSEQKKGDALPFDNWVDGGMPDQDMAFR
ncbi:hypothetical protein BU15DRAFT_53781 [Melanogaster broomeanus]|nr:hypothetical protein BU15DRAFT_53781 [Melanogaster broomeanus]